MAPRKQYKTARGRTFDMVSFVRDRENTTAIGNLGDNRNVNARGDILGKGGKIVKKREEIVRQYYREELPTTERKSIKENPVPHRTETVTKEEAEATPTKQTADTFVSPDQALKQLQEQDEDQSFEEPKPKRKKKTTKKEG